MDEIQLDTTTKCFAVNIFCNLTTWSCEWQETRNNSVATYS